MAYLKGKVIETFSPPLFLPARACTTNCNAKRWDTIKGLLIWQTDEDNAFGIFKPWNSEGLNATVKLCPSCQAEVKKYTDNVREDFWAHLPPFFCLPTWEDLKDSE